MEGVKADYIPIGPEQRLEPAEQQTGTEEEDVGGEERGQHTKRGKEKKHGA